MSDAYNFLKHTGAVAKCISDPPTIPEYYKEPWRWFIALNNQRQEFSKIPWSDISAYFSLIKIEPTAEQLDIIQKLDHQYLEIMASKEEYIE